MPSPRLPLRFVFAAAIAIGAALLLGLVVATLNGALELYQRISEFMLQIAGEDGGRLEPVDGNADLHAPGIFLTARAATIYGGASEVQRNIIAKNVLRLP